MVVKLRVSDYHRSNGTVWKQVRCAFVHDPGNYDIAALAGESVQISEMHAWCTEEFGIDYQRWHTSLDGHTCWYFCNPQDCTAFLLRWS